ncbi:serine/arginine repetitive matrix protein 1 isoform X2 [Myripristis murdjan]|uniref:Si:ch211-114c12.2 n=1 Tax=Myripristis murdjan TaxID=586833 RepID=A0A667Y2F5_9TELE|nr:serine/arginine repetitive matrix protein 1-like isoform X2 [Myripristis murdjan]
MVRPHFGPPRYKPRPYTDGPGIVPNEHYNPNSSRNRRDVQDYPGKAPSNWREPRGRGRPTFGKRVPLMGEQRQPAFNQWRSHNQNSFQEYPPQMEPHHGQRRPSPSRPIRPPHVQHQSSSRNPVQGSPGQRGPPFHGHSSGHRSPSPRHYRNHPADRRPGSPPPYQGSFRGPKRQPGFPPPEQRGRDPRGHYSPREKPYEHSSHGMKRWNGAGVFSHPHSGEHGSSGSQRKPRELHGRGPCPERWSTEQDSRRHRGEMEREGRRSHSTEKPQEVHSHLPPYRSPSWKGGPSSSSYHNSSQERQVAVPRKRRMSDLSLPSTGPPPEHSNPKHPRRERPQPLNVPRSFGGKPLSLRDRSRIMKGRQFRAESVMKLRAPPMLKPKPRMGEFPPRRNVSSILAIRKKRFESNAVPPTKLELKRAKPHQSPPSLDGNSSKSSRDSDTVKEKVESRRSLSTHSSSPIEKLSCDLVVVSHWQAGPSSSSKGCSSPRDHSPKSKTERSSDSDANPKTHDSRSSFSDRRGGPSDKRNFRPMNMMQESYRPMKPFRRPGPPPRQRLPGGPRRPPPEMAINFRRPLMEGFVPRPFPHQKPVFRKSQSIMSKYRNMQVMRQRPPYSRGPNQQRW